MTGQAVVFGPNVDYSEEASRPTRAAWLLIGVFCSLTAGTTLFGPAVGVRILYTPMALGVALLLSRYDPALYVGFAWWIAFLSPLVRRLVDYRIGYDPTSPILMAPLVVMGASAITLWRYTPQLRRLALLPFALLCAAVLYGFIIGLLRLGPWAPLYGVLTWLAPILFGFHLATQWRQYPRYRQILERTFVFSTLILGAYGVWQFVSPPPWDTYWIVTAGQRDVLSPQPFSVRLFGTLTSFGPFGLVMMVSVLVSLASRSWRAKAVLPIGLIALLLSSVRTAWGGLLVGLVVYLAYLPGRRAYHLLATAGTVSLLLFALSEPFRAVIEPRLRTFIGLEHDKSFQTRRVLFEHYSERIAADPVGLGVGATGRGASLMGVEGPGIEHGFQDIFYSLGWLGGATYCLGMGLLFAGMIRRSEADDDNFAKVARAVAVALLAMSLTGKIFVGVAGAILWSFIGVHIAARAFHAASKADHAPKTGT